MPCLEDPTYRHARDPSRQHLTRPRSPVAGHRGGRRPSRRRRCRVHEGPGRRLLVRHVGGLQAAGGVDRDSPERGAGAGHRHQRLDAGRRVPVQRAGAARRPGGGRGARATTARCWPCASWGPSSWRSRWRTTASTWPRWRARSRAARARSWRTSSPTSTTPPAARSRARSGRSWWPWPSSTTSCCSRTTRTWSCASRASPSRRCCRWTPPTTWSTRRRSRRRSAPASASATWPAPRS